MPQKYKLNNNLSVLLIESNKSPVVSVQMWVRTGSADEQKGQEGISHFIEHLVFKGTKKYAVGEIASIVETSGGELNAFTSFDQTVFYVTISKEFFDVALDVVSQMMGSPLFDSDEIDNEREVVLEEIKRSNDSLSRQASRLLFETNFKDHPYGIPVIGYDRVVKKVPRKKIIDYYESRYIPSNMQLVVSGDFERKEMRAKVKKYFSSIQDHKLKKVKRKKEQTQKEANIKVKKTNFEESIIHCSWKTPGVLHEDIPALDVLALILGQGESSRLVRKLRVRQPLVNSVGAGTFTPKDHGLFDISASFNHQNLEPILEGITGELETILREPPSSDDMEKAIRIFESDQIYSVETVEGIARKAGMLEDLTNDYKFFKKYLSKISKLTASDILKVARKYLKPSSMNFVMITPQDEKQSRKHIKAWLKNYKDLHKKYRRKKIDPTKKIKLKKLDFSIGSKTTSEGQIERRVLDCGLPVVFRRSKSVPILSAKTAFLGGLRVEPSELIGMTELMSRSWSAGTKKYSENEIQENIERVAGGISAFSGRNTAGVSIQCLSAFQEEAAQIYSSVLSEPLFEESIIKREKYIIEEVMRSRADNPAHMCSLQFLQELFSGHPYALDPLGSQESLQKIANSDVMSHYEKMVHPRNGILVLSGDFDIDVWCQSIEEAFASRGGGEKLAIEFPVKKIDEPRIKYIMNEKEQSHIMFGYQGLGLKDPNRYVLQIIQSMLAGQGGRLFLELRDKASLAYSVSPMRLEGIETGYFGAYIGCSPEKGKKALDMLQVEFNKLCEHQVEDKELDRAKRYLIGRHDIDLQKNSAITSSILFNEIYGLPGEEIFSYGDEIKSVTGDSVQKLAQQIFSQEPVISIVGPTHPLE